jgi:DNA polymerase-4
MDAFYVSVELLRHPELRGLPVVVGGSAARGVVAAASYEARCCGVHSALSGVVARRRCPSAVFLPPDLGHYAEVSAGVHNIFQGFTPHVEPLALDEAFLDVSGAIRLWGTGTEIAQQIRNKIADEIGLPCSVGVASNKFLSKLASVEAKPRATPAGVEPGTGVWEVRAGTEQEFLDPLEVRRLWGVGPATAEKLTQLGIRYVRDLRLTDRRRIVGRLGVNLTDHLIALAHGRDERPVISDRQSKSIGNEDTFAEDLTDLDDLHLELLRLADQVTARIRRDGRAARTLTLKVKFGDFQTITRSETGDGPFHDPDEVLRVAKQLLSEVQVSRGVRLLGVSLHNLGEPAQQLTLFGAPEDSVAGQARNAVDAIREKFGTGAIGPASLRLIGGGPSETSEGSSQIK